jgi:hypothetical protein
MVVEDEKAAPGVSAGTTRFDTKSEKALAQAKGIVPVTDKWREARCK